MPQNKVPDIRIRALNAQPVNPAGSYVLYWMLAARRTGWNFALQRAVELAGELGKPLVILECLSCDVPYASDRLHRFVLDGMVANARALAGKPVLYYPFVSRSKGDDRGLLPELARTSCLVVSDDYPAFIIPKLLAAAARELPVRLEVIDGNGLLPMRLADRAYPTAYAFRRFLQKTLPRNLYSAPSPDPLAESCLAPPRELAHDIVARWPATKLVSLCRPAALSRLPIDHSVTPAAVSGGADAARTCLEDFINSKLSRYTALRNHPDEQVTSGLSAYLHFGQICSHAIFAAICAHENWTPDRLGLKASGRRAGWWGMSENAEAFLDQLITWRELGYNMCTFASNYREYRSLPEWAIRTLDNHCCDHRPYIYNLENLDNRQTHDPLWNAAQRQLQTEGTMHNYLRMLWGKKILEWSPSPQAALQAMIELNDRYALDGRDPNSYSGIFWCLGRYDRPWGPIRPIFGSVRYMSSENTQRKLRLKAYLNMWG